MHPLVHSIILPNTEKVAELLQNTKVWITEIRLRDGIAGACSRTVYSWEPSETFSGGNENKPGQIDPAMLSRHTGICLAKCITVCCCHTEINGLLSFPFHMGNLGSSLLLSNFWTLSIITGDWFELLFVSQKERLLMSPVCLQSLIRRGDK